MNYYDYNQQRDLGIYVHIPFCLSKCAYCALYSEAVRQCDIPADFAGLYAAEFALRAGGRGAGIRASATYSRRQA